MGTTRRAVIDVGTNSVKLLVADADGGDITPILEDSEQTRLGAGFFSGNRLQPQAIALTAQAVATFANRARELKVASVRVIATSAARDAVNQTDLISAIERAAGLHVEVISGDQEADLAFQGVNTNQELARHPLLLLDVGGGSTEFILGQGEHKQFRQSFQLGTVRLLEQLPPGDPPAAARLAASRQFVKTFLGEKVRPSLEPELEELAAAKTEDDRVQLVGTGGTAAILGRMEGRLETFDRERIEGARLNAERVSAHVEKLWALPLAERRNIPGLPKNRADVILFGVVIYEGVMSVFGFSELRISTRGLRFAAVMDAGRE